MPLLRGAVGQRGEVGRAKLADKEAASRKVEELVRLPAIPPFVLCQLSAGVVAAGGPQVVAGVLWRHPVAQTPSQGAGGRKLPTCALPVNEARWQRGGTPCGAALPIYPARHAAAKLRVA